MASPNQSRRPFSGGLLAAPTSSWRERRPTSADGNHRCLGINSCQCPACCSQNILQDVFSPPVATKRPAAEQNACRRSVSCASPMETRAVSETDTTGIPAVTDPVASSVRLPNRTSSSPLGSHIPHRILPPADHVDFTCAVERTLLPHLTLPRVAPTLEVGRTGRCTMKATPARAHPVSRSDTGKGISGPSAVGNEHLHLDLRVSQPGLQRDPNRESLSRFQREPALPPQGGLAVSQEQGMLSASQKGSDSRDAVLYAGLRGPESQPAISSVAARVTSTVFLTESPSFKMKQGGGEMRAASVPRSVTTAERGSSLESSASSGHASLRQQGRATFLTPSAVPTPEDEAMQALERQQRQELSQALTAGYQRLGHHTPRQPLQSDLVPSLAKHLDGRASRAVCPSGSREPGQLTRGNQIAEGGQRDDPLPALPPCNVTEQYLAQLRQEQQEAFLGSHRDGHDPGLSIRNRHAGLVARTSQEFSPEPRYLKCCDAGLTGSLQRNTLTQEGQPDNRRPSPVPYANKEQVECVPVSNPENLLLERQAEAEARGRPEILVLQEQVTFYRGLADMYKAKFEDSERRCAQKTAELYERELEVHVLRSRVLELCSQNKELSTSRSRSRGPVQPLLFPAVASGDSDPDDPRYTGSPRPSPVSSRAQAGNHSKPSDPSAVEDTVQPGNGEQQERSRTPDSSGSYWRKRPSSFGRSYGTASTCCLAVSGAPTTVGPLEDSAVPQWFQGRMSERELSGGEGDCGDVVSKAFHETELENAREELRVQREQIVALQAELERQRQRFLAAGLQVNERSAEGVARPDVHLFSWDNSVPRRGSIAPREGYSPVLPEHVFPTPSLRRATLRCSPGSPSAAIDIDSPVNTAESAAGMEKFSGVGDAGSLPVMRDFGSSRLVAENKFLKAKLKSIKAAHQRLKQELHSTRQRLLLALRSPLDTPNSQARGEGNVLKARASDSSGSPLSFSRPHQAEYFMESDGGAHGQHVPARRLRSSSSPILAGQDSETLVSRRSSAAGNLLSRATSEHTVRLGRRSFFLRSRNEGAGEGALVAGHLDTDSERKRLADDSKQLRSIDESGGMREGLQSCPPHVGADSLIFSWDSERRSRLGFKGLALRRELALRRRINARRKQRCVELQKQVDFLSSSLDMARQQVIEAQSVGLNVSHQLQEREEEARVQQFRSEAAGKLLRQAQKRLYAGEQLIDTVREQHREFKLLHARHAESLEENQQLRLQLEILERQQMQLLQQAEASRRDVLELLESKRTAQTMTIEVDSLEGRLREFERDREAYRLLELHAEELERRLEAKEEQVRLLRTEVEAATVRARTAERECERLRAAAVQEKPSSSSLYGLTSRKEDESSTVASSGEKNPYREFQLQHVLLLAETAERSLQSSVRREQELGEEVLALERRLFNALMHIDKLAEEKEELFARQQRAGGLYVQQAYACGEGEFWTGQQMLQVLQNRAEWAARARNLEQRELDLETRLLYAHQQGDGLHEEISRLERLLQRSERRTLWFAQQFFDLLDHVAEEDGEEDHADDDYVDPKKRRQQGEEALNVELSSWRTRCEQLAAAHEEALTRLEASEELTQKHASGLVAASAESSSLKYKCSSLEDALQRNTHAYDRLEEDYSLLQRQNDTLQQQVVLLQRQLDERNSLISHLEQEVESENTLEEKQSYRLIAQRDILLRDKRDLIAKINRLEQELQRCRRDAQQEVHTERQTGEFNGGENKTGVLADDKPRLEPGLMEPQREVNAQGRLFEELQAPTRKRTYTEERPGGSGFEHPSIKELEHRLTAPLEQQKRSKAGRVRLSDDTCQLVRENEELRERNEVLLQDNQKLRELTEQLHRNGRGQGAAEAGTERGTELESEGDSGASFPFEAQENQVTQKRDQELQGKYQRDTERLLSERDDLKSLCKELASQLAFVTDTLESYQQGHVRNEKDNYLEAGTLFRSSFKRESGEGLPTINLRLEQKPRQQKRSGQRETFPLDSKQQPWPVSLPELSPFSSSEEIPTRGEREPRSVDFGLQEEKEELESRWKAASAECEALKQQKAELETRLQDLAESCAAIEAAYKETQKELETLQRDRAYTEPRRANRGRRSVSVTLQRVPSVFPSLWEDGRPGDRLKASSPLSSWAASSFLASSFLDSCPSSPERRVTDKDRERTKVALVETSLKDRAKETEDMCQRLRQQLAVLTELLEVTTKEKDDLAEAATREKEEKDELKEKLAALLATHASTERGGVSQDIASAVQSSSAGVEVSQGRGRSGTCHDEGDEGGSDTPENVEIKREVLEEEDGQNLQEQEGYRSGQRETTEGEGPARDQEDRGQEAEIQRSLQGETEGEQPRHLIVQDRAELESLRTELRLAPETSARTVHEESSSETARSKKEQEERVLVRERETAAEARERLEMAVEELQGLLQDSHQARERLHAAIAKTAQLAEHLKLLQETLRAEEREESSMDLCAVLEQTKEVKTGGSHVPSDAGESSRCRLEDSLHVQLDAAQEEFSRLRRALQAWRAATSDTRKELERVTLDYRRLLEERREEASTLQGEKKRREDLERQVTKMREEDIALLTEEKRKRQDLEAAFARREEERELYDKEETRRRRELEETVVKKDAEISNLQREIEHRNQEQAKELEAALSKKTEEIHDLEAELETVRKNYESLEKTRAEEEEAWKGQCGQLEERIQDVSKRLRHSEEQKLAMRRALREWEERDEEYSAVMKEFEGSYRGLQIENLELKNSLAAWTHDAEERQRRLLELVEKYKQKGTGEAPDCEGEEQPPKPSPEPNEEESAGGPCGESDKGGREGAGEAQAQANEQGQGEGEEGQREFSPVETLQLEDWGSLVDRIEQLEKEKARLEQERLVWAEHLRETTDKLNEQCCHTNDLHKQCQRLADELEVARSPPTQEIGVKRQETEENKGDHESVYEERSPSGRQELELTEYCEKHQLDSGAFEGKLPSARLRNLPVETVPWRSVSEGTATGPARQKLEAAKEETRDVLSGVLPSSSASESLERRLLEIQDKLKKTQEELQELRADQQRREAAHVAEMQAERETHQRRIETLREESEVDASKRIREVTVFFENVQEGLTKMHLEENRSLQHEVEMRQQQMEQGQREVETIKHELAEERKLLAELRTRLATQEKEMQERQKRLEDLEREIGREKEQNLHQRQLSAFQEQRLKSQQKVLEQQHAHIQSQFQQKQEQLAKVHREHHTSLSSSSPATACMGLTEGETEEHQSMAGGSWQEPDMGELLRQLQAQQSQIDTARKENEAIHERFMSRQAAADRLEKELREVRASAEREIQQLHEKVRDQEMAMRESEFEISRLSQAVALKGQELAYAKETEERLRKQVNDQQEEWKKVSKECMQQASAREVCFCHILHLLYLNDVSAELHQALLAKNAAEQRLALQSEEMADEQQRRFSLEAHAEELQSRLQMVQQEHLESEREKLAELVSANRRREVAETEAGTLRKSLQRLEEELQQTREKGEELSEALGRLRVQLESEQELKKNLKNHLEESEKQVEAFRGREKEFETLLERRREEVETLKTEALEEREASRKELEREREVSRRETEDQVSRLRKEMEERLTEEKLRALRHLQRVVDEKREQHERAQEQLEKRVEQQTRKLEQTIHERGTAETEFRKNYSRTQAELEQTQRQYTDALKQSEAVKIECDELREQVENLKQRHSEVEETLQKSLLRSEAERKEAEKERCRIEMELERARGDLERSEERRQRAEADLKTSRDLHAKDKEEWTRRVEQIDKETRGLRRKAEEDAEKLTERHKHVTEQKEEITNLKARIQDLSQRIEQEERRSQELTRVLQERADLLEEHRRERMSLEASMHELRKELEQQKETQSEHFRKMQHKVTETDKELLATKRVLQAEQHRRTIAEAMVAQDNQTSVRLERLLTETREELDRERGTSRELEEDLAQARKESRVQQEQLELSHQVARNSEERRNSEVQRLLGQIKHIEEREELTRQQLCRLREDLLQSNEARAAALQTRREVECARDELQAECTNLQTLMQHAQDQLKSARRELEEAQEQAGMEQERTRKAEERAGAAEEGARAAIERAHAAEERVHASEERVQAAEERVQAAEERVQVAEERARAAEEQAQAAEERAHAAKERAHAAEERAHAAEERVHAAEEQARAAEERVQAAKERETQLSRELEDAKTAQNEEVLRSEAFRVRTEEQMKRMQQLAEQERIAADAEAQRHKEIAEENRVRGEEEVRKMERMAEETRLKGEHEIHRLQLLAEEKEARSEQEIQRLQKLLEDMRACGEEEVKRMRQASEKDIERLSAKAQQAQQEADDLRSRGENELQRLHQQLEKLQTQAKDAAAESERLHRELEEAQAVSNQLDKEKHAISLEKASLEGELAQLRAFQERQEGDSQTAWDMVREAQQREEQLQRALDARDAAANEARRQWATEMDEFRGNYEALCERLRQKERQLGQLEQQLEEGQNRLAASCSAAAAEMHATETRYESKIAQLQEESRSIKAALEAALEDCRKQAEEHQQMLRETLGETQTQAMSLQKQLDQSRAELTGRQRAWQQSEQQSREESAQLKTRCANLEADLRAQEFRVKTLEQQCSVLQGREEDARRELQVVVEREASMHQRFQQTWQESHLSTEELLLRLQREEQNYKLELTMANTRLQDLQQQRERDITEWSREKGRLQSEIDRRAEEVDQAQQKLAEVEVQAALASEEVGRMRDEIAVLRIKDEALQRQLQTSLKQAANEEQAALGVAERRCNALEAALKSASESRDRNAQHCAGLRRELGQLARTLQRLKEEGETRDEELEQTKRRASQLQEALDDTRRRASELHTRCRVYQEKVEELLQVREGGGNGEESGAQGEDSFAGALAHSHQSGQRQDLLRQAEVLRAVIEELGQKLQVQQEQQLFFLTQGHQHMRMQEERQQGVVRILERRCEEVEVEREVLRAELQRAEASYSQLQTNHANLEKENEELKMQVRRLVQREEEQRHSPSSASQAEAHAESEALKERRELIQKLTEKEIQQAQQEESLVRIRGAVEELKAALKTARRERDENEYRVSLLRKSMEQLRAAEAEWGAEKLALAAKAEEASRNVQTLDTRLKTEKARKEKMEEQMEDLETTFALDRAALEERCQTLQDSLETARAQLRQQEGLRQALLQETKDWAAKCKASEHALGEERAKSGEHLRKAAEERRALALEMEKKNDENNELRAQVGALERLCSGLEAERVRAQDRVREEEERRRGDLTESRTAWESRCEQLRRELSEARDKLREAELAVEAERQRNQEMSWRGQAERRQEELDRVENDAVLAGSRAAIVAGGRSRSAAR
ncbi:surface antigen repeat-containing protein, partial [Cystoisospora suis]